MKKVLPVIIILIGLSLLGLVILQASWLRNLLRVREQQVEENITKAQNKVTKRIAEEINNPVSTKVPSSLHSFFNKENLFFTSKEKLVKQQYSLLEIKDLIDKEFEKEKLGEIKYEFGVLDDKEELQMYSNNFLKIYYDSLNRIAFGAPIVDLESTDNIDDFSSKQKLIILVTNFKDFVWGSLLWVLIGSAAFTIIIFAAFYITVRTMFTQKKLSEIKSDFINNMTHEFKTPLATISLAVDALKNEKVINDPVKLQYFSNIIKEENKRMNTHVETILQAALLEKKEIQFKVKIISANIAIATVVDNFQLQLNQKEAICNLQLNASPDEIEIDELHFSSVISNLVDNAIKYSKEKLILNISTFTKNNTFCFKIEDNGIGMSKESLKNIFEKFYRAHTGNVHNVKGFGLGMNYVKTIIDHFDGNISVSSILGKGTTFIVDFPLKSK